MSKLTSFLDYIFPKRSAPEFRGWVVIFGSSSFFFFQMVIINMMNVLNIHMLTTFNITAADIGYISSCYYIASILSLIPAGLFLDRYSIRTLILSAMSISIFSTFLFGLSPTPTIALISRFIAGLSGAFCFISSLKLATRWFAPAKLARVTGFIVAFGMLGGILAQTPLCLLADHFGWRITSVSVGVLGICLTSLVYKFVKDFPGEQDQIKIKPLNITEWSFFRAVIANRQNWLTSVYISLMNLPIFIFGALWGALLLTQNYALSTLQASQVNTMLFVGMIVGSPSIGWLSDSIKRRKSPMIFFSIAMLLPITCLVSLSHLTIISLMIIFFAIGFFCSAHTIGYSHIAECNSKSVTATAEGLASTLMIAGGLTQYLFGWLLQYHWSGQKIDGIAHYNTGDFNRALALVIATTILSIFFSFFLRETRCKEIGEYTLATS